MTRPAAEAIGRRVRNLRQARGITQASLASIAGLSTITINRLERGHHNPGIGTLAAIADALEVPLAELATLN